MGTGIKLESNVRNTSLLEIDKELVREYLAT